jgi:hypothetical protein
MCPSNLYANDSDEASQIAFSFENIPYLKLTNQNIKKMLILVQNYTIIRLSKNIPIVHEKHQLISFISSYFSH